METDRGGHPASPDRTPLFLGLTRPPMFLGLPIGPVAVWAGGSTLLYLFTESFWTVLPAAIGWGTLRLIATREPQLFGILAVVARQTPRSRNRRIWNGDSHG